MNRTYRYRLYPTNAQARRLDFLLWQGRNAWNATSVQQLLRHLDKAFVAFFRRLLEEHSLSEAGETPGFPRFKGRDRFNSLEYRHGDGCKLRFGKRVLLYVQNAGEVNLDHLNFLVEDVEIAGQPMGIIHIYSKYPKYDWVNASGEGIACVDDAARAAIVYLNDYELTGDKKSLDKAKRLLNFVMYMQAEDGEFYNFIYDRQGTINKTGNTSYKSAGWWAVRGAWALGVGYRVLKEKDKGYAKTLELAFQRIRDVWVVDVREKYSKYSQVHLAEALQYRPKLELM